jgi:mono/diheme cytochrome c family protein
VGRLGIIFASSVALLAAIGWVLSAPHPRYSPEQWQTVVGPGDAVAGRLVFFSAGCDSCHATQGQSDPQRLGGGLELRTPFGSFYPPNISSDPTDGIGRWSDVEIANAVLSGVSPRGEYYFPAFPYTSYQRMQPKDVADLIAFIRTLPPVQGRAPPHRLPFPFSFRRAVGVWQLLFFDNTGLSASANKNEQWRRGRYLVEGPGHCGECHTPRNLLGAMEPNRFLAGASAPDGKGKAPGLTSATLGDWSVNDIVEALTSGFTPAGDVLGAGMTGVVRNLARLPQSDRESIAEFLKSLPDATPPPTKP